MTGAIPVPEQSGGRDHQVTAVPPVDPGSSGVVGEAKVPRTRSDEIEAGIVALWRAYGKDRDVALRDRLVLHYAPLVKYVRSEERRVGEEWRSRWSPDH